MSDASLDGTSRYLGLYQGTIVDVSDPKQLRRVRVAIPGVTSKSAWAWPRGGGAGAAQRGGGVAPMVGQEVLIQFVGGEIERPVWEGGPWGAPGGVSDLPADLVAAGSAADQVSAIEFARGDYTIRATVDERAGSRSWRVVAVQRVNGSEQVLGSIEIDLEQRVLDIFALGGVQIRSLGFVDIRALAARIQRRRVRRSAAPL